MKRVQMGVFAAAVFLAVFIQPALGQQGGAMGKGTDDCSNPMLMNTNCPDARSGEPNWTRFTGSSVPAKVLSIRTPNGNHISTHSSAGICWQKWCVTFPSKLKGGGREMPTVLAAPYSDGQAFMFSRGKVSRVSLSISPLECSNDVLGKMPCFMSLSLNSFMSPKLKCEVFVGKTPAETINPVARFQIACPDVSTY